MAKRDKKIIKKKTGNLVFQKRKKGGKKKKENRKNWHSDKKKNGYSTFAIGRANSTESKKKRKGTKEENKIE